VTSIQSDNLDENKSESSSCCTGGASTTTIFKDQEEWTESDFQKHGSFQLPYHPFDLASLISSQKQNSIHTIWVLPYAHKSNISIALNESITEICSKLMKQDDERGTGEGLDKAVVAFTVHPNDGKKGVQETTLQAIVKHGARAAKLHCSVGKYSILHENLTPFWQLANQVLFPVIVHFGTSISGNTATEELRQVENLLETYPNVRLVIAHSGHPAVQWAIRLAIKFDNVYLDTTPVGE